MRITLNLATRPFIELRPLYTRLRIWMAVLVLLAVPLWLLLHTEQQKAIIAISRVNAMQANVQRLERQQQSYQTLMRQPENAAVLTQSDLLNGLFRKKAFSWTATMTDLETVLPPGVQVLSIDPVVARDGRVAIHLRVSGARDRAIDLMRNLEKSRHFASPRLEGESLASSTSEGNPSAPQTATGGNVNFDIVAGYRPLPLTEEGVRKIAAKPRTIMTPEGPAEAVPFPPSRPRHKRGAR